MIDNNSQSARLEKKTMIRGIMAMMGYNYSEMENMMHVLWSIRLISSDIEDAVWELIRTKVSHDMRSFGDSRRYQNLE